MCAAEAEDLVVLCKALISTEEQADASAPTGTATTEPSANYCKSISDLLASLLSLTTPDEIDRFTLAARKAVDEQQAVMLAGAVAQVQANALKPSAAQDMCYKIRGDMQRHTSTFGAPSDLEQDALIAFSSRITLSLTVSASP